MDAEDKEKDTLTTSRLIASCLTRNITIRDLDELTVGQLVDIFIEQNDREIEDEEESWGSIKDLK
jgi:hypothetical protein